MGRADQLGFGGGNMIPHKLSLDGLDWEVKVTDLSGDLLGECNKEQCHVLIASRLNEQMREHGSAGRGPGSVERRPRFSPGRGIRRRSIGRRRGRRGLESPGAASHHIVPHTPRS